MPFNSGYPHERLPVFWEGPILGFDVTVFGYFDDQDRIERVRVERAISPNVNSDDLARMSTEEIKDRPAEQSRQIRSQILRECEVFAKSLSDRYGKGQKKGVSLNENDPTVEVWRNGRDGIDLRCFIDTTGIDDAYVRAIGTIEVDYRYLAFGGGSL